MNILVFRQRLAKTARREFEWGVCDCCLWAADLVKAAHGIDFSEPFRGTYRSERGALRIIRRYGGMMPMISEITGIKPVGPIFANVGDPVLATVKGTQAIGIKLPAFAIFKAKYGVVEIVDLSQCNAAWNM